MWASGCAFGLLCSIGLHPALAAEGPAPAPPATPAAPGASKVAERATGFLATWLAAYQGGPAAAFEALYAADFVGTKIVGKKRATVPRAQWLVEQGPGAQARPLLIREGQVSGSSQHMVLTLQVQWQAGKQQGQGARDLVLAEQGGALRIVREYVMPGRPPARRAPPAAAPAAAPTLRYRCSRFTCPEAAAERVEVQRECAAACAADAGECAELASLVQTASCGAAADVGRAIDLWARACADGHEPKSCDRAAQLLQQRKGEGDAPRALRLLGCEGPPSPKTCNSGLAAELLVTTGEPRQIERALKIYLRGCGPEDRLTGSPEDCEKAAALYRQGPGRQPDADKAAGLEDHALRIRLEMERRAVEDPRVNRHRDL